MLQPSVPKPVTIGALPSLIRRVPAATWPMPTAAPTTLRRSIRGEVPAERLILDPLAQAIGGRDRADDADRDQEPERGAGGERAATIGAIEAMVARFSSASISSLVEPASIRRWWFGRRS